MEFSHPMPFIFHCFSCNTELAYESLPGRGDSCPKCAADVKVCLNCLHYDPQSYNECREPSAERVVDKTKRTFCDYFHPGNKSLGNKQESSEDSLKKLEDLFK